MTSKIKSLFNKLTKREKKEKNIVDNEDTLEEETVIDDDEDDENSDCDDIENWSEEKIIEKMESGYIDLTDLKEKQITDKICIAAIKMISNDIDYEEDLRVVIKNMPEEVYKSNENIALEIIKLSTSLSLSIFLNGFKSNKNGTIILHNNNYDKVFKGWYDKDNEDTYEIAYNLSLEVVKRNGIALQYVPNTIINYELCINAVRNNGMALLHVPRRFRDYDILLTAIRNDGDAISIIPKESRTEELYYESIKSCRHNLVDIDKKYLFRYSEFCKFKFDKNEINKRKHERNHPFNIIFRQIHRVRSNILFIKN